MYGYMFGQKQRVWRVSVCVRVCACARVCVYVCVMRNVIATHYDFVKWAGGKVQKAP